MANPTTNFGWQMPTSTDLVTDLPADFEVFGQAVDTALAELKGGTTGQVLSKTSNTNMDFTWVTQDDANAIQNTQLTAKGALITAFSSATPATLTVGNNGETLVADSSTSTGLRYTAGTVQSNPVLNSAMQVWQRGTSITGTAAVIYTADRWSTNASSSFTITRQTTSDTTNLPNIQYCARVQRTAGQTTTTTYSLVQSIETLNSIPFAGKTVTMSFYARKGANYSGASSAFTSSLISGTGTDQNYQSGYTGTAFPLGVNTATLTTTWQRFTYTGTIPATATELGFYFDYTPVGTAGAADYYEVTGAQLDIGSVALPFRTYAGTIQGELAACQRYFNRLVSGTQNAVTTAQAIATTGALGTRSYPQMRTGATITVSSASHFSLRSATNTTLAATGFNYFNSGTQSATIYFDVASGLVAGNATEMSSSNASATLDLSAEL